MFRNVGTKVLATIGKCIYCNSKDDLSDEHIIPYGLGGNLVLAKASCSDCARITSRFEKDTLRKLFRTLRSAQKLPTRRQLPSEFLTEAILKENLKEEITQISPEYLPSFLPLYEPPAFFDGRPVTDGVVRIKGKHNIFSLELDDHLKQRGITQITHNIEYVGGSFERLLAKIAYGHSIALYGLENIEEKIILPLILGKNAEFNKYIGMEKETFVNLNATAYHSTISTIRHDGLIVAYIQLFGFFLTPIYTVIVGKCNKEPAIAKLQSLSQEAPKFIQYIGQGT